LGSSHHDKYISSTNAELVPVKNEESFIVGEFDEIKEVEN